MHGNGPLPLDVSRFDAAIFDWDGTLVDSRDVNFRAWRRVLAAHKVRISRRWYLAHAGLSGEDMLRELAASAGDLPAEPIAALAQAEYLRAVTDVRPVPWTCAVARRLHARMPLAIASGGRRQAIEPLLPRAEFRGLFSAVVTRDDVANGKPAPDILVTAARRLGVDQGACLVFEDTDEGIAAADAAAMKWVDVRPYRDGRHEAS